ncbi:hypothetical protein NUV26_01845 [Burkholderia pseudomultivorans]|uniref:hypothetical protein n=1 Tax=Burkholderia pseudomultivorans TaxID=1207504 RepID=UPI00075F303E|nr:hypothetical protein [Burkholderia pseudomultivorans]AOI90920.1 hypothetical protein WS57_19070 [Burkholderia pseudomultivorans]KVC24711.1 hypothetical protein WS55_01645 [Burkholderia pseudomultivorans]KVC31200.1 hypothetical protein WS56_17060 [Burkholderia pseudomultivorans]KVC57446.1 hypothetical protein WS58_28645 [Burkholderia pseudomultivorans]MDS0790879.1 hypothetical protein [Burkholderia pseudomultivorans]
MTLLFRLLALACALWLAACSSGPPPSASLGASAAPAAPKAPAASERSGLGTAWGESVRSETRSVEFERANPTTPTDVASVYYNDVLPGHPAASQIRRLPTRVALANGDVSLSFTDEHGAPLHLARGNGRWHMAGVDGSRYMIVLRNQGRRTFEIVSSVDGLDVLSGRPGSYRNGGYVLYPGRTLTIEGFRKSRDEVAAFRFASVPDSYVANSKYGDTANVGVIGVALFAQKESEEDALRRNANPFPGNDNGFAPPPAPRGE